MTPTMKVYQIAESLGMEPEVVVTKIKGLGIPVNNKMSKIDVDVAERIKLSLQKERQQDWVEVDLGDGIRKRVRKAATADLTKHRDTSASAPAATPEPAVEAAPSRSDDESLAQAAHDERSESSTYEASPPVAAAVPSETQEGALGPESNGPSGDVGHAALAAEFAGFDEAPPPEAPSAEAAPGASEPGSPPSVQSARTGTVVYDPVTKTVTHVQSGAAGRSRSVQVDPRRFQNDVRGAVRAVPGQRMPGPGGRMVGGRRVVPRPSSSGPARTGPAPAPMGAHKRVVKIESQIALQELARRMAVKAPEVLVKLLQMGMTGVNINTTLDADTAKLLAQEFQYEVEDVAVDLDSAIKALLPDFVDDPADYVSRPPVVTVMGHVDHGKTTLLDAILGLRVAEGEAGGITQKVSAYLIETRKGPVVFFDTPGHEAFTKLRARGAEATDVAVLVVAADDGVMPTTVEAIHHAKAAQVPIVVALNKIDKADAKPERVVQQLMANDVIPEEFGGDVLVVKVSAKQRTGIEELLESLALQSEVLDLRANPKKPGKGTVFDATLDKGRGVVARVLVQDGTIRSGDVIMAGTAVGKIRAMFDDRGKPVSKAGPSMPVEILGLPELPNAGENVYVVADAKKALVFAEERRRDAAKMPASTSVQSFADIERRIAEGEMITVGVIIKAEAQASVEALSKALTELSTEKVRVQIVHTGIGGITESDVNLAIASKLPTTLIGFNVRPQGKAGALAEAEKVNVRLYNIIYEALDDMKAMMLGQLKPTSIEKPLGKAEVRQVFQLTKVGQIAGCYVIEGMIKRTARARLVRDSVQVWEGKLASLRRFKEDMKEVATGYECGIGLENFNDVKPGDVIEAFEMEEVAAKL